MPLDADQTQKLEAWQRDMIKNRNCVSCMHYAWTEGELVSFPAFSSGSSVPDGPPVRVVQISCQSCGHISQYLASKMGI